MRPICGSAGTRVARFETVAPGAKTPYGLQASRSAGLCRDDLNVIRRLLFVHVCRSFDRLAAQDEAMLHINVLID